MTATPSLTEDLQNAHDASNGIVQGSSFVLMKPEVVLDWFGFTVDELRQQLQPAIEQVEHGECVELDLPTFLAELRRKYNK